MAFNSALSGGQITQVQQSNQFFRHFLLVTPQSIVWQAQVNQTISATNYAEFTWVTTLQGTRTNVKQFQVAYITTSASDFTAPVLRTYIRQTPDATKVYIGETDVNITTSMYITVFNDYDIFERIERTLSATQIYKDWDVTYTNLPPTLSGIQSAYVDVTGAATVTWSFAPTGTVSASGASISSWLWDVADGTITVGSTTTQNVTVQFPGSATNQHRWVSLKVTDSNGVFTTLHFQVFTVTDVESTVVKNSCENIDIQGSVADGYTATITPWENFVYGTVLDNTRIVVVSKDSYGGTTTPIVNNILFIGRMKLESNSVSNPDGRLNKQLRINCDGVSAQLANLRASDIAITDVDSPSRWGEVTDPTATRAIVYYLAYNTTFFSVCTFTADTSLDNFISLRFPLAATNGLDNINKQAMAGTAVAAFSPDGELTIRRMASYLSSSDRSGLTTVYTFITGDLTDYSFDLEYQPRVSQVVVGGIVYNTTIKEAKYQYRAQAPAQSFGSGYETAELDGQILTANATDATGRSEMAVRAANHLIYINPKVIVSTTVMDGFYFLRPTLHQRYVLPIDATTNYRGRVFGASDYWQLIGISYTLTVNQGICARITRLTFEEETLGNNANIFVSLVVINPPEAYPVLPPYSPYLTPLDPLINFPTDTPVEGGLLGIGWVAEIPGQAQQTQPGEEILNISMRTGVQRSTTRDTVLGDTYVCIVQGYGYIDTTEKVDTFSVDSNVQTYTYGTYVLNSGDTYRVETVGDWSVDQDHLYRRGDAMWRSDDSWGAKWRSNQIQFASDGSKPDADDITYNSSHIYNFTRTGAGVVMGLLIWDDIYYNVGSITVNVYTIGTQNGDAFYQWSSSSGLASLYSGTDGLVVNGAKPSTIPLYNTAHSYEFVVTGTGSKLSFEFNDSDFSDNQNVNLVVKVVGTNMGYTP